VEPSLLEKHEWDIWNERPIWNGTKTRGGAEHSATGIGWDIVDELLIDMKNRLFWDITEAFDRCAICFG